MSSENKKRKAKNRAKSTVASDRYYLGQKDKEYRYGMFNSALRKKINDVINDLTEEDYDDEM